MKLWLAFTIFVSATVSKRSDASESKELCKITDPVIYNFKINAPRNMDIPNRWFKNHPSYLNHTKDSFAEYIGKQFEKFLATVASGIPNYIEIPNVLLQPVSSVSTNATKGEIRFLREIMARPRHAVVYSDWSGTTLVIKFVMHLDGLRIKYHVKSTIPKFDGDVEWVLLNRSAVVAMMRVTPTGNCPIKFEENDVETAFTFTRNSRGGREQLAHLTVLLKCYIHFFLEEAVYFALKQLWKVLKNTICFSVKYVAQSDDTLTEI